MNGRPEDRSGDDPSADATAADSAGGGGVTSAASTTAGTAGAGNAARRRLRTRALITAAVVAVAAGGTAVAVHGGGSTGHGATAAAGPAKATAAAPGPAKLSSLALRPSGPGTATLPQRSTHTFTTVGVTWNDPAAAMPGTVEVRTRSTATGTWSDWRQLASEDADVAASEASPHTRGGTEPMWVGPSDGVQARVRTANGGTAALPAGLTLALVDPGAQSGSGASGAAGTDAAPAGYVMDDSSSGSTTDDTSGDTTDGTTGGSDDTTGTSGDTTGTTGGTDTGSPTPSASDSPSASATPTTVTPTTAAPTTGAPTSASPTTATPTAPTTPPPPSQLPSLAQAYPASCSSSKGVQQVYPSPLPPAPKATSVPMPKITTRAGWGANECTRETGYPDYGQSVKVVFVHHTDDPNTYSCSDSAKLVQAAYTYHVKSEGWRDIGYDFLVDKCGNVFEGRFGGMALPVVGAQTYGMNTNSAGIAAIGTYTDLSGGDAKDSPNKGAKPTTAMLGSIAAVAEWKLSLGGYSPKGTNTLVEGGTYAGSGNKFKEGQVVKLNDISGHRDGFATDCPGNQLYSALGTIRNYAAGPVAGLSVSSLSGGAGKSGSTWYTTGKATVSWTTSTPSQVIKGFDVLVDGTAVAHVSGTARSAAITVGSGSHKISVRATHISGSTTTSGTVTLVRDTTAPTFSTKPALSLRTGTVSTSAVPVTLKWRAADGSALASVSATTPSTATFGPTTTSWSTTAKPGATDTFTLRAKDAAGNTATASTSGKPTLVQETSAAKHGSWSSRSSSSYLGGKSLSSASKGASLTWTFTGRSVSWIVSRAAQSGKADVYVDGKKVTTVDLKSSKTAYRQAIWTTSWSASGKHTLKIVVDATAGRPTITTDGIAVLG